MRNGLLCVGDVGPERARGTPGMGEGAGEREAAVASESTQRAG